REIVVGTCRAAIFSVHLVKRAGRDEPFVQRHAADPQRVVETLVRTGAKAVERHREAVHTKLRHGLLLLRACSAPKQIAMHNQSLLCSSHGRNATARSRAESQPFSAFSLAFSASGGYHAPDLNLTRGHLRPFGETSRWSLRCLKFQLSQPLRP